MQAYELKTIDSIDLFLCFSTGSLIDWNLKRKQETLQIVEQVYYLLEIKMETCITKHRSSNNISLHPTADDNDDDCILMMCSLNHMPQSDFNTDDLHWF